MIKKQIELSGEFKAQTSKAIFSIALFLIVYLILVAFAIGLTILCVYAGIMLIITIPRFITIILGLGLASLGFLVLIFLFKFIFTKSKVDRSHLREITAVEAPELFRMIRDIVQQVGTSLPKRVYVSSEVNAAVFYDSSFWSMFFPIKKNLQIGLALVNSVTVEELKAILAHEFGHFSQRTMKVGSYVYNVNRVIYNMLYDNDAYEKLVSGWANISGYVAIFVMLAVKIIEGIQWILQKMYTVVNLSYMGLSREMEFHADEIAANVTGYVPLKDALLRLDIAEKAYSSVLNFYGEKVKENRKSENIYPEHAFVMNFLARENRLPLVNDLPQVTLEEGDRYNQSKLVIKDQWASHPSTEERVRRLEQTNLINDDRNNDPSGEVFTELEKIQQEITNKLFGAVQYHGEPSAMDLDTFKKEFKESYLDSHFNKCYNGYYDRKNPIPFEIKTVEPAGDIVFEELFSATQLALVDARIVLENDIEVLRNIANNTLEVKSYDYDGQKFDRKNSPHLLAQLTGELEELDQEIKQNDIRIFQYFRHLEQQLGQSSRLATMYREFFAFDKFYEDNYQHYAQVIKATQFIGHTNSIGDIKNNFRALEILEEHLKDAIRGLVEDERFQAEI